MERSDIEERVMFGGIAFMARGHMCCGVVKDKLMVRINPDTYDQLLGERGAEPMDFTGKPMRGFIYVTGVGTSTSSGLRTWVSRALNFAESRPPKSSRKVPAESMKRPNRALQPTGRAGRRVKPRKRRRAARG